MTTAEYLQILARLHLPPYGQATREALGLGQAQIARLAKGLAPVTPTLERLLRAYDRNPALMLTLMASKVELMLAENESRANYDREPSDRDHEGD